jgi:hypothetical protein
MVFAVVSFMYRLCHVHIRVLMVVVQIFFSIGHILIGILAQKLKLELIQMLNEQVNYHVSILDPQS